jgi:hypothetical protein
MRSLVLIAALAGCSGILFAQAAPVKMGLWEKKMTMDMGTGTPRQLASKSCITPESWQEMVGNMSKPHEGCTVDNVKNAHGYTFTATCKTSSGGTMVTSGSETIQDSQHIVFSIPYGDDDERSEAGDGIEIHEHVLGRRLRQDQTR